MPKVFIGVGHGGTDPGAVGNGLKEKDLTLAIATHCRNELVRHGVTVKMSREKDEGDPVKDEVAECNKFSPALAVDIHINAGGGDGFEAYYYHGGGKSKTLAQNIEAQVKAIGQNSRGCKTRLGSNGKDYYAFIRDTAAPAVILEAAFIDSADIRILDTAAEQEAFGVAYAKGILKTLGINYQPINKETSQNSTSGITYNTLAEVPAFGRATVTKLMEAGALKGDASGKLNLSHDMLRQLVINDRMGLYNGKK